MENIETPQDHPSSTPPETFSYQELERQVERLKARKAAQVEADRIAKEEAAEAVRKALEAKEDQSEEESETISQDLQQLLNKFKTIPAMPEAEYREKVGGERVAEDMKRWGFPDRYRQELSDWGNPIQKKVFHYCQKLLGNVGAVVALVGIRGTGKTTIASQLGVERAWQDWDKQRSHVRGTPIRFQAVPYWKMSDLIARYKPLYADFGTINQEDLTHERNEMCFESDLLIIDELHDCEDQKMKDRILTDIVDKRYSSFKDTLLISNQLPEQFEASTSESVLSRLHEHGMIIACTWDSWRDKLADGHTRTASVK